jgi:glycine/D-amino acid oxidase-like deaminating enzyme
MCVGVLGGGLQGCCVALALAERGARVVLFDKNDALLTRAAVANEGKIHLGYMYAGDPTLSTAKTMMAGALAFAPVLERYHTPAGTVIFGVGSCHLRSPPRQSTGAEDVHAYLQTVHALINEAADRREQAYFGKD